MAPAATIAEPVKAGSTKGMTFEEKKKARASRFKLTTTTADTGGKTDSRKRERGNRGKGKDDGKRTKNDNGESRASRDGGNNKSSEKLRNKNSNKPIKAANLFDSLSKDELEKRLERARKYGVVNETVDGMKIALRKFRFEGK